MGVKHLCPDTVDVERPSYTPNNYGGQAVSYETVHSGIKVRFSVMEGLSNVAGKLNVEEVGALPENMYSMMTDTELKSGEQDGDIVVWGTRRFKVIRTFTVKMFQRAHHYSYHLREMTA